MMMNIVINFGMPDAMPHLPLLFLVTKNSMKTLESGELEASPLVLKNWKHNIHLGSFCCAHKLGIMPGALNKEEIYQVHIGDEPYFNDATWD